MNVMAEPLSRKNIHDIAYHIREEFELEKEPYFPIVEFIEFVLMNPINGMNLEILSVDEMEDTYGNMNTARNTMQIREDVYIRAAIDHNPRDRFTLCHELGHFLLHQPEQISHARGNVPPFRDPEWQANTFAAELMAPYEIIHDMSVSEITSNCGMSYQAAEIQFNECHKGCEWT